MILHVVPKMLNKLHFNNLVITNKKKIQQARVRSIQKLVQRIRKLKCLQEKKPEDGKIKERIRKNTECMEELKKLKREDIMKRILVLDGNPTAVLTNGRAIPEELATAMLAVNKILNGLAKQFREELKLDKEDQTWKETLMQMSRRRAKTIKTKEKRRKRSILKEQKSLESKRLIWIQENQPNPAQKLKESSPTNDEANELNNVSNIGGGVWKIEKIPKEEKVHTNEQPNAKVPTNEQPNAKVRRQKIVLKNRKQPDKTQSNTQKCLLLNKIIRKLPINEQDEQATVDTADADVTHVLDPFFVTDTGENYLSTAVNIPTPNQHENRAELQLNRNSTNKATAPWRNREKLMHTLEPHNRSYKFKTTTSPITQTNRKERYVPCGSRNSELEKTNVGNLHPSWLAKQQQKPIIANFQGKKITFDTDDD